MQEKIDMRFGIWNVRSLYRAGSLKTVADKMAKCNSEIKWFKGGSKPADDHTFFCGNGNANHHLGTDYFVHLGIRSAVKRVKFISDRMCTN
jgi:hypothetical protein